MAMDRIKGKANDIIGTGKEKAGRATDDPDLEAEGTEQKTEGKVQETVGKVKDKVEEIKDKIT